MGGRHCGGKRRQAGENVGGHTAPGAREKWRCTKSQLPLPKVRHITHLSLLIRPKNSVISFGNRAVSPPARKLSGRTRPRNDISSVALRGLTRQVEHYRQLYEANRAVFTSESWEGILAKAPDPEVTANA